MSTIRRRILSKVVEPPTPEWVLVTSNTSEQTYTLTTDRQTFCPITLRREQYAKYKYVYSITLISSDGSGTLREQIASQILFGFGSVNVGSTWENEMIITRAGSTSTTGSAFQIRMNTSPAPSQVVFKVNYVYVYKYIGN